MHPFLNTAITAARKAGNIMLRHLDKRDTIQVREKARHDFVSDVDFLCEQEIITILRKAYPEHGILAEETGPDRHNEEYVWLIDPIDGTNNYLHGLPFFCTSIALKQNDQIMHAVVYAPALDELFVSSRGHGSRLNSYRIRVSQQHLDGAFISTGLNGNPASLPKQLQLLQNIEPEVASIRTLGSAALELAYVAAGRIDAYWEHGLNAWDIAAGSLIVQEAGGFVSDCQSQNTWLQTGDILAANPKLHTELIKHFMKNR